jgi:hypothetical protein
MNFPGAVAVRETGALFMSAFFYSSEACTQAQRYYWFPLSGVLFMIGKIFPPHVRMRIFCVVRLRGNNMHNRRMLKHNPLSNDRLGKVYAHIFCDFFFGTPFA